MGTATLPDSIVPAPRVEVITSVQRRRRWSAAEKVRLVEEAVQSGSSVSFVARRYGLSPSLLFRWERRMIEGGHAAVRADEDGSAPARSGSSSGACATWNACSGARLNGLTRHPGLGGCLDEERALAAAMPQAEPASSPSFAPVRAGTI